MRMRRTNAEVTLEFKNVAVESKVLTVMYYENSWIPEFAKSVLRFVAGSDTPITRLLSCPIILHCSGLRRTQTTAKIAHKIELPDSGAQVGDTFRATF